MPRVTVVEVKRFPSPADNLAVLYVGHAGWGWPQSPWANPYHPAGYDFAERRDRVAVCLSDFALHAARQPDAWWSDLWAACEQGRKPLGCWCYAGDAAAGVGDAAILAAELNRRFVDPKGGGS